MKSLRRRLSKYQCKCCRANELFEDLVQDMLILEQDYDTEFIILSGYRCPTWNKKVGGSKNSEHMKGTAVDFTHTDQELLEEVAGDLQLEWDGGFSYYKDKKFIHIDKGRRRRW